MHGAPPPAGAPVPPPAALPWSAGPRCLRRRELACDAAEAPAQAYARVQEGYSACVGVHAHTPLTAAAACARVHPHSPPQREQATMPCC